MSIKRLLTVLLTALVAAMVALGVMGAPGAWAVPQLTEDTSPAAGETLAASPPQLILVFNEKLGTEPGVVLLDANGLQIPTGLTKPGDSTDQWIVPISSTLPPGVYRVKWSAVGTTSEYTFNVGQAVVTPGATPGATTGATPPTAPGTPAVDPATVGTTVAGAPVDPSASTTVAPVGASPGTSTPGTSEGSGGVASVLGLIARWASTLGLACVFGGLAVIALAWPEGVEYVITSRYLRTVWLIALGATVVLMIATRAQEPGESLGSAISPPAWLGLKDLPGGSALLLRFVFIAASGWVVLVPERVVDASTQIPAFAAPTLALLTYGFNRSGEAAGGAIGAGASIVHAISFAVWLGGVALLARVVVIGPGDEDLLHAVRGFSRLAGPALIGVVLSGVVRTMQLAGGGNNLFSTGYGRLLLLKAAGVAALAYIATVNRQTVRNKLGRAAQLSGRAAGRLRRAFSAELLVGVLVMGLAAWMLNSVPPGAANAVGGSKVKPVVQATMKDSGIDVSVGAAPGVVGANTIVITIRKPVTGLVDMGIQLLAPGAQGGGIEIPKVHAVLKGKGSMRLENVPLDVAGTWTVVVNARDTDGALPTVQGTFEVFPVGVDPTDQPSEPTDATTTTVAAALLTPAVGSPNAATTTVAPTP